MRDRADTSSEVADAFFDAAAEPARWFEALNALTGYMGGTSGLLVIQDPALAVPRQLAAMGFSDTAKKLYADYYHAHDLWAVISSRRPTLHAHLGPDLVCPEKFVRSEIWNDFGRPHIGGFHLVGAAIPLDAGRKLLLGIHRPQEAAEFDETDRARLNTLTAQLQASVALQLRLEAAEFAMGVGLAALERLDCGVIVADGGGRMTYANPRAEALLLEAGGTVLSTRGLSGPRGAGLGQLARLVAAVCAGGTGGAVQLAGRNGTPAVWAHVSLLPYRLAETPRPRLALITLRAVRPASPLSDALLKQVYGFTPAEAAVARGLMEGATIAELAEARGVSVTTLRSQVSAILGKAGVRRQSELLRDLAGLAVLAPGR